MNRVYFIRPVGMAGPIKIGCSGSPELRRQSLDNWSPFALEIIAQVEGGFDLERRFHALFLETHQRREWFGWSRRLAATIEAINDGTFDVATLPAPMVLSHINRTGTGTRLKEWTPLRRFCQAYDMRRHALFKRGMNWSDWDGPTIRHAGYTGGPYAHRHPVYDDIETLVRACEAFADEMTAKWGHDRMKPVRWVGPFPAVPADRKAA